MAYNATELARLHRAGKAYKLRSGAIIPTDTAMEVGTAITQAKGAQHNGGDEDEPGFRAHLIGRAAAHGVRQLIPASWAREQAGKSAGLTELVDMEVTRVDGVATPANGYGVLLAKSAARAPVRRPVTVDVPAPALDELASARSCEAGISKLASQGRLGELQRDIAALEKTLAAVRADGDPLAKAAECERRAAAATDRVLADGYRQRAREIREQLAGPAGHLAKAAEYEQRARQVIDPRDRSAYRELAAQERRKAGAA